MWIDCTILFQKCHTLNASVPVPKDDSSHITRIATTELYRYTNIHNLHSALIMQTTVNNFTRLLDDFHLSTNDNTCSFDHRQIYISRLGICIFVYQRLLPESTFWKLFVYLHNNFLNIICWQIVFTFNFNMASKLLNVFPDCDFQHMTNVRTKVKVLQYCHWNKHLFFQIQIYKTIYFTET